MKNFSLVREVFYSIKNLFTKREKTIKFQGGIYEQSSSHG